MVVGGTTALYLHGAVRRSTPLPANVKVCAAGAIGNGLDRWLLGCDDGSLYMLQIMRDQPTELKLERLGEVG